MIFIIGSCHFLTLLVGLKYILWYGIVENDILKRYFIVSIEHFLLIINIINIFY